MKQRRVMMAFILIGALLLACDLASLPFVGNQPLDDLAQQARETAEAAATLAFSKIATPPAAASAQPKAGTTPTQAGQQAPQDPVSQSLDALSKLNSFHYKWVSETAATQSGKTQTGTLSAEGDVARNPAAIHVTYRAAGQPDLFECISIGNKTWLKVRGAWTEMPGAAGAVCKQFEAATIWSGVFKNIQKVQSVGVPELKNGELAWHYRVTETSAGLAQGAAGIATVQGDYWISVARGYPVSFVYKGTVKTTAGESANFTISWDVTNVDKPVNIAAPK